MITDEKMIADFSFKNFLSFKDQMTLSMVPWPKTHKGELDDNVISLMDWSTELLKSAVIYGSNASGKSNVLKAIDFMKWMVLYSHKINPNEPIFPMMLEPFRLNTSSRNNPSFFELSFMTGEDIKYTYNFSLTKQKVVSENLIAYYSNKPTVLFTREWQDIDLKKMKWGEQWKTWIRENTLVVSVLANYNVEEALKINKYFSDIHVFWGRSDIDTMNLLETDTKFKDFLIHFIKIADSGIQDLKHEQNEIPFSQLQQVEKDILKQSAPQITFADDSKIKKVELGFSHDVYDDEKKIISRENIQKLKESLWTQSMFDLAGSVYNVIKNGKILFIDEIDRSLHPLLLKKLISVFHNSSGDNISKKYQFIFNTHDTNILDIDELFRRDQVWFTEKNKYGESKLYSLLEFKERKWSPVDRNYLKGRYGANPLLVGGDDLFANM